MKRTFYWDFCKNEKNNLSFQSNQTALKWIMTFDLKRLIKYLKNQTSVWFLTLLLQHVSSSKCLITLAVVLFIICTVLKHLLKMCLLLVCFVCVQLSSVLSSEVHSVRAGRYLASKLNVLVQQHFDLGSTTITNIPMKVRLTVKHLPLCLSLSSSLHHLFALYWLLTQLLFSWFIVCFASLH